MLDSQLLTRLERVRFLPRRVHTGSLRGERLSSRKGISIEFADYRQYVTGDDVRHLDWNIYGRLDRPVVRTYRDETELPVYLLIDASASMAYGSPPKWDLARDLAAALGYIALSGGDALYPLPLTQQNDDTGAVRGRGAFRRFQKMLNCVEPDGRGVVESLQRFAHMNLSKGMALLISDGLDPEFPEALRLVRGRGHELVLVHVLSNVELLPELEGDLKLLDSESGGALDITATASVLREYRRRLEDFCTRVDDVCRRSGAWSVRVNSRTPVAEVIFRQLRRLGVVGIT